MATIENFLKRNEEKISFARYILFPVLLAACLFALDARYLSRSDYSISNKEQRDMIITLSADSKASFNKLTDAVTALTNETRNNAEYQRANGVAIATVSSKVDRHESSDSVRWEKIFAGTEKLADRLNKVEARLEAHEVVLQKIK